jgi:L-ribulokinase
MQTTLGLDFGTESVRALLVSVQGTELASASASYPHGQITRTLPGTGETLPPHYALQHPDDWLTAAAEATKAALKLAALDPSLVAGIGVDFTSCTMLPTLRDGTPLCLLPEFSKKPLAWPKLWKHHGAQSQADRINALAQAREEGFLRRYGGAIGLEWFFPKILETLEGAPEVYAASDVWLEAGDWLVWRLVGGSAETLPRSTCQAGYKGMWSPAEGWPSPDFLNALHPALRNIAEEKLPGRFLAPGCAAGGLSKDAAALLGLPEGTPVSAATIDAHAGVPGAGASEPGTLVLVLGTSSCHMLNSPFEKTVPGVAGIVPDGILSGYCGYETGQAAVGDAFDWLSRLTGQSLQSLGEAAAALAPGADGLLCLDWLNGCRTPLMDGSLKGAFTGIALHHGPAHFYRAMLEGSAFGLRWIVELLRNGGVPVSSFVATGGLPHHNPLVVQVYADVLGSEISVHPSKQGPALGSAILGALAAGIFKTSTEAIHTMATPSPGKAPTYRPKPENAKAYEEIYAEYRRLARFAGDR